MFSARIAMEHNSTENSSFISNTTQIIDIDYSVDYILLFRLVVWGYIGMVLSIFGIVGNIITILVLISPSMRTTSTNIYLTAISCSNILFLLIFIPTYSMRYLLGYSVYMSNQPPFAFEILLLRLPTTPVYNTIVLSMIYLTLALSIDRLISVKFPLEFKHILTQRRTLIAIFCVYLFSILYCIPYWLEQEYDPKDKVCRLTKFGQKIYKYTRIYVYIPVVYVVPLLTLACVNTNIIKNLIKKKRRKQSLVGKTIAARKKTADYHITLMLVAVVIAFVLSQLPLLVLNVWYAIDHKAPTKSLKFQTLNSVGVLLLVLNTSTNFLLYCCFGQKFRQTLIEFILNLFPNHMKTMQRKRSSLKQNQLSIEAHHRCISRSSSATTNDSKMIRIKVDDLNQNALNVSSSQLDQIPLRKSDEQLRPLLPSPMLNSPNSTVQLSSMKNSPSTDSHQPSPFNTQQILTIKI
ncbi:unnamed protein product [Adineta ricciae]|uniref:G-protein coupled receptors family 1 profile domain-containing protein n=2 Tax=Adineta ricciae TaxID=249248 RepID=A0A813XLJ9_ADIRI|nr:unnamed protein product [Adineta ricciae]